PRLRLLQPQRPRKPGRGLHHVPRTRGPHAAHVAGGVLDHGVVPGLPPPAGAVPPPARPGLQRLLRAARGPARAGPRARPGVRHPHPHQLLHVPPMSARPEDTDLDLSGLRRRLADSTGRTYWKSLEELAGAPQFLEFLHREFPEQASSFDDPEGRRGFLKVMGASLALAGLTGCTRQPEEKIVPYVKPPEEIVPGRPLFFATAVSDGGYAKGVLVESHMGRPTKIEGNPDHPASLGATDVFGQASVLDLYDPDRAQTLTHLGEIRPWGSFLAAVKAALD